MTMSNRVPIVGIVSTTYLTREAAKSALDSILGRIIPGLSGGRAVSAATALLYSAATDGEGRDKLAATAALLILLGDEYDHFMAKPDLAVERTADRMKSV